MAADETTHRGGGGGGGGDGGSGAPAGGAGALAGVLAGVPVVVRGERSRLLAQEVEEGNVEYKLHLLDPNEERFRGLVTQMMWRCREGGGAATYNIGVTDAGVPVGLPPLQLERSLGTLRAMAAAAGATIASITIRAALDDDAAQVAEVRVVRPLPPSDGAVRPSVTVAVTGGGGTGKSTWIACVTQGVTDDGAGRARYRVFRHRHEVEDGRTSSLGHHLLGFDAAGNAVTPGRATPGGAGLGLGLGSSAGCGGGAAVDVVGGGWSNADIVKASTHTVELLDLAGDPKYMHTTLAGLLGAAPEYVQLMLPAAAAAAAAATTAPPVSRHPRLDAVTREHLLLAVSLRLPMWVVVTKIDAAPAAELHATLAALRRFLSRLRPPPPAGVSDDCVAVVSTHDGAVAAAVRVGARAAAASEVADSALPPVPVFLTSAVTGAGLPLLCTFLAHLPPRRDWHASLSSPAEYQVEDTMTVDGATVVAGHVRAGCVVRGDRLALGPDLTGRFTPVVVASIQCNRIPVASAAAGAAATFQLASLDGSPLPRASVRRGQVLLAEPAGGTTGGGSGVGGGGGAAGGAHAAPPQPPARTLSSAHAFEADVTFCRPAHCTFRVGASVMVHCAAVRQAARVMALAPLPIDPSFGPPPPPGRHAPVAFTQVAAHAPLPDSLAAPPPPPPRPPPLVLRGSSSGGMGGGGGGGGVVGGSVDVAHLTPYEPAAPLALPLVRDTSTGGGGSGSGRDGRASPPVDAPHYHASVRVLLRFAHHPEYLVPGASVILRDGTAIAAGSVVRIHEDSRSTSAPPVSRRAPPAGSGAPDTDAAAAAVSDVVTPPPALASHVDFAAPRAHSSPNLAGLAPDAGSGSGGGSGGAAGSPDMRVHTLRAQFERRAGAAATRRPRGLTMDGADTRRVDLGSAGTPPAGAASTATPPAASSTTTPATSASSGGDGRRGSGGSARRRRRLRATDLDDASDSDDDGSGGILGVLGSL